MKIFRMRNEERGSSMELTVTADGFKGTKYDAMTAAMWEITHYHIAHKRVEDIRSTLLLLLSAVEDEAMKNLPRRCKKTLHG